MILNVNCPINKVSYGYVSSYLLIALRDLGYDLRHIPIGPNSPDQYLSQVLTGFLNSTFDYNADCLKIWHQHSLHGFTGNGKRIGFPIFELEDFSDQEKHCVQYCDYILTCSKWGADVIKNNTGMESGVVPLGYDPSIFKVSAMPESDTTIFANFGKFEVRKGHDILIDAFNAAFEKDDDVALVMMPHNPFLTQEETNYWFKKYTECKLKEKIEIIPRLESQLNVYNIMKQVHCGVFPARAEGWNLEALELLATGRHLIITNCTGHTEFCNDSNSRLIQCDSGYESAIDNKFFFGQGRWKRFGSNEFDQLVEHMREVHQLRSSGQLKTNLCDARKFTWKNSGNALDNFLKSI